MALYILSVPFTTEIYPQTRHGGGGGGCVCDDRGDWGKWPEWGET